MLLAIIEHKTLLIELSIENTKTDVMKNIYTTCLVFCNLSFFFLNAQTPILKWPVTDNTVNTMVHIGNTLYIGGPFSLIGPNSPYGAVVNNTNGLT